MRLWQVARFGVLLTCNLIKTCMCVFMSSCPSVCVSVWSVCVGVVSVVCLCVSVSESLSVCGPVSIVCLYVG